MAGSPPEQRGTRYVRFDERYGTTSLRRQARPIRPIMSIQLCTAAAPARGVQAPSAIAGRLGLAGVQAVEHHERRRRPRCRVTQSVKLYDPESGRYFAGHTCDISDGGLRLELPARLPALAGRTACVYIAHNGGGRGFVQHTQMLPVRYVWVRRDARTGTATCGVELLSDTASIREAA